MSIGRDTPEPIKRKLRQEAAFGCCVCGHPFYEYHHILEFSDHHHHNPADMMLLCPNHHHEATVHALDENEQRSYKARPFNIERGFTDGLLRITARTIALQVSSNLFVGSGFKFIVDDEPILQLDEDKHGRLLVSLDLYDRNNIPLLSVSKNEWLMGDPFPWDFEFGFRWIKLRRKQRDIALHIDARATPVEIKGDFWRNGEHFSIRRDSLLVNGVTSNIGFVGLGFAGLMLVADTASSTFSIQPDPKFGKGEIVAWPDPVGRLERTISAYEHLKRSSSQGKEGSLEASTIHLPTHNEKVSVKKKSKIGRNSDCPCGSGSKYKRCCGA